MPVSKKLKSTTNVEVPTKKVVEKVVEKTHKPTTKKTTTTTKSTTVTPTTPTPNSTKLHHCSFSSWLPKSINSISYNEHNNLVAVGREDTSIDIWIKKDQDLTLLKTLGGSKFELPIIKLFWLKNQITKNQTILLVIFENKFVIWDTENYTIIQELNSIGTTRGADFNQTLNLLAVCTNDSTLRLYNFDSNNEIEYQSSFPSVTDSKTNVVQWLSDNKTIACGCTNQLVLFKLDSLRSILNVTTDNIISINSLNNDTIVCGFINGFISIIDIKFGGIIQDFRNLHSPVRSIQVNRKTNQFFTASDEGIVVSYNKTSGVNSGGNNGKWAVSGQHKRDSHDIKCMDITSTHLISGGNSTQLIFYELSNFTSLKETSTNYIRCKSLPLSNTISITSNNTSSSPILLIESSRRQINIWSLGSTNDAENLDLPNGTHLSLSEKTKKLLQFESKNPQNIENVDISNNGEYFCFSTRLETKLYSIIKKEGGGISIKRIELPNDIESTSFAKFTKDSKYLIAAKNLDEIYQLNLSTLQVKTIFEYNQDNESEKEKVKLHRSILSMEIDNQNKYLSIIDSLNQVLIFNIENFDNEIVNPTKLPNLNSIPIKLFYPTTASNLLYIGTIDSIILFDIKLLKIKSTKSINKPIKFITENPNNNDEILIWTSNEQFKLNKELQGELVKASSSFTDVIFVAQSGNKGDLVLLDLSYFDKVLPTLPEAIKVKKFGGSQ